LHRFHLLGFAPSQFFHRRSRVHSMNNQGTSTQTTQTGRRRRNRRKNNKNKNMNAQVQKAANAAAKQAVASMSKTKKKKTQKKSSKSPYPILSCHNSALVPCGTPSGKAAAFTVEARYTYTSTSTSVLYVFTPSATSREYGAQIDNGAIPNPIGLFTGSQYSLDQGPTSGGPISSRAAKLTIDIRNTSPAGAVGGGTVYVLECDSRLGLPAAFPSLTQANVNTLMTTIRNAPGVSVLTGADLVGGRTYSCKVADFGDYEDFGVWYNTVSANGAVTGSIAFDAAGVNSTYRPMTNIFVLFDNYSGTATYPANTYDIRVQQQLYLRFDPSHVAYTMQRQIPLASAKRIANIYQGKDFRSALIAA